MGPFSVYTEENLDEWVIDEDEMEEEEGEMEEETEEEDAG
jgi:hypothetical protein